MSTSAAATPAPKLKITNNTPLSLQASVHLAGAVPIQLAPWSQAEIATGPGQEVGCLDLVSRVECSFLIKAGQEPITVGPKDLAKATTPLYSLQGYFSGATPQLVVHNPTLLYVDIKLVLLDGAETSCVQHLAPGMSSPPLPTIPGQVYAFYTASC